MHCLFTICMRKVIVENFDLAGTMESGQLFPFTNENGTYRFLQRDKWISVRQEGDALYYSGCNEKYLKHFFRLDEDESEKFELLNNEKGLREAVKKSRGLRIMRQDPWQCTMSFICSQNSNIPRIQSNIMSFVNDFGNGVFPEPGQIKAGKKLKAVRLGYREKYIAGVNKLVNDEYFEKLRELSYTEAKEELCKLPGIGPKVADCILLFSLDHLEAFPVDVWIKRGMEELYFDEVEQTPATIEAFGRNYFGKHAGYAQQYLYHWRRFI